MNLHRSISTQLRLRSGLVFLGMLLLNIRLLGQFEVRLDGEVVEEDMIERRIYALTRSFVIKAVVHCQSVHVQGGGGR